MARTVTIEESGICDSKINIGSCGLARWPNCSHDFSCPEPDVYDAQEGGNLQPKTYSMAAKFCCRCGQVDPDSYREEKGPPCDVGYRCECGTLPNCGHTQCNGTCWEEYANKGYRQYYCCCCYCYCYGLAV